MEKEMIDNRKVEEYTMYQVGEYVIYGGNGVCRVDAIGTLPIDSIDPSKTYYTLIPVFQTGIIYAPTDVPIKMRPIISAQEAWTLISKISASPDETALPADAKLIAAEYQSMLETYDCTNLFRLIRTIYAKNKEAIAQNRSYGQTDDRFMRRAKELLYGELAMALGISFDKVEDTITKAVEGHGVC